MIMPDSEIDALSVSGIPQSDSNDQLDDSDIELVSYMEVDTEDEPQLDQKDFSYNFPKRMKSFISVAVESFHGKLFERVFKLLLKKGIFFNGQAEREDAPYEFKDPKTLESIMKFGLGKHGVDEDTLVYILEQVIQFSPHNSHPFKLTSMTTGLDPFGIAGDWIVSTMTSCVLTYLYAPVFTLMEMAVLRRIRQLIGYESGTGDGVFCSDSGHSTCMAISLALKHKFSEIKIKGFSGVGFPRAVMFVREGPYLTSYKKYGMYCGIGTQGVIPVKVDKFNRMVAENLAEAIEAALKAGSVPFMVVGTLGSEYLGSIDALDEVGGICEKYKLWYHVSGDLGAGCWILSDKRKGQVKGIEKSDSFSWSQHDGLSTPCCSTTLVTNRIRGVFMSCFGLGAKLVFEQTYLYESKWDTGDFTNQTTRRANVLKFWLMWKAKGRKGLAAHVEKIVENVKFFTKQLNLRRKNFVRLIKEPQTNVVAFYYSPSTLRHLRGTENYTRAVNSVTDRLRNELLTKGIMHLDIGFHQGYPNFFSIALNNTALTKEEMIYILDQIEYHGSRIGQRLEDIGIPALVEDDPENSTALTEADSDESLDEDEMSDGEDDDTLDDFLVDGKTEARQLPTVPAHSPGHKYHHFVNAPIRHLHEKLFEDVISLIKHKGLYFQRKRNQPALIFEKPELLLRLIPFDLDNEAGSSEDEVLKLLDKVIHYSAHQAHPHYIFQIKSGLDPYGLMADYVITTMSSPSMAYIDSPVYTLMEREVLKCVRERIGFPLNGDGNITTGGSAANILASYVAQTKKFPGTRKTGITGSFKKKLMLFMSDSAHYCPIKGAMFHGSGEGGCVLVASDESDRMIPSALKAAILDTMNHGGVPFIVIATMGTTALGAIDPINEIADICEDYNLWLHADGAYGGPVIFSEKYKRKLAGIDRADSFSFNAHKMLNVPTTCTAIVFKEQNVLTEALNPYSDGPNPYPAPTTSLYNMSEWDADIGKHYESKRRPDIMKFWFLWKAKGMTGMGKHIDYCFKLAQFCVNLIKTREDKFELLCDSFELTSVCFYYIPKALRGITDRKSPAFRERITKVAFILQARIIQNGKFVFVVGSDEKRGKYCKISFISSGVTKEDIIYFLDQMDNFGHDIDA